MTSIRASPDGAPTGTPGPCGGDPLDFNLAQRPRHPRAGEARAVLPGRLAGLSAWKVLGEQ